MERRGRPTEREIRNIGTERGLENGCEDWGEECTRGDEFTIIKRTRMAYRVTARESGRVSKEEQNEDQFASLSCVKSEENEIIELTRLKV